MAIKQYSVVTKANRALPRSKRLREYGVSANGSPGAVDATASFVDKDSYFATVEKLSKVSTLFSSMFELDEANKAIKAKMSLYSVGDITAMGIDTSGSGGNLGDAIAEITAAMVVLALGYTPYDAANPAGYITSSELSGYATQNFVNAELEDLSNSLKTQLATISDATDELSSLIYKVESKEGLFIGRETRSEYKTYIYGREIFLRYGADREFAISIRENGNVGIGVSRTDYKLEVDGNVKANVFYGALQGTANDSTMLDGHLSDYFAAADRVTANEDQIAYLNETTSEHTDILGTLTQRVDGVEQLAQGTDTTMATIKDTVDELSNFIYKGNNGSWYIGRSTSDKYKTYIEGKELFLRYGADHNVAVYIRESGNVGIGVSRPSYKLEVDGDVKANIFRGDLAGTATNATKFGGQTTTYYFNLITAIENTLTGEIGAVGDRVAANEDQIAYLNETTSEHAGTLGTLIQRVDELSWAIDDLSSTVSNKFDISKFTKANIKSTLGISDWALASSLEWNAINNRPTALSQFTDDVVAGKYLPKSGGVVSGLLGTQSSEGFGIFSSSSVRYWIQDGNASSYIAYDASGEGLGVPESLIVSSNNKIILAGDVYAFKGGGIYKIADNNESGWLYQDVVEPLEQSINDIQEIVHTDGSIHATSITIGSITLTCDSSGALVVNGNISATGSVTQLGS